MVPGADAADATASTALWNLGSLAALGDCMRVCRRSSSCAHDSQPLAYVAHTTMACDSAVCDSGTLSSPIALRNSPFRRNSSAFWRSLK